MHSTIVYFVLLLTIFNYYVECADENVTLDSRYGVHGRKGLSVVYEWKQLDWEYDSEHDRHIAISNGEFVPGVAFPIDIEVHYADSPKEQNQYFISVPRFNKGIPASFNTITANNKLKPYPPDWSWHTESHLCRENRIVSVFRTVIDECNRLWFADTGVIEGVQVCPPQILAFDLRTDKLLIKYEVPQDLYDKGDDVSLFITPAVDVRDPQQGCKDTFIYLADVTGYALLVFDVTHQHAWKITNNLFYPYPNQGHFQIAGESFDLMDGVFGLALSPYIPGKERTLFFHSLASVTENKVSTAILRNHSLFGSNHNAAPREFHLFPNIRPSQATAIAIDRNGIEYFVLTKEMALACWNTHTDYNQKNINIIEMNKETLQFASNVKLIRNRRKEEELWITTIRFQKIMNGSQNKDEINFRVLAAKVDNLVKGTRCANPNSHSPASYQQHHHGVRPVRRSDQRY